jgi:ubiquitin-protein ligase
LAERAKNRAPIDLKREDVFEEFSSGDRIFDAFLRRQHEEGLALARASDIVTLVPLDPQHIVLSYACHGLIRTPEGGIAEATQFEAGVYFPSDYLRRADPFQVLAWFGPREVWHPNISNQAPLICVGKLAPGTPLVDLVYRVYEIIAYHRYTPREDDALNKAACAWARNNAHRFPIDRRPLKRRQLALEVHPE